MLPNLHMDYSINLLKKPFIRWKLYCFEAAIMIIIHYGAFFQRFCGQDAKFNSDFMKKM
jgi:hypothetical protein